MKHPIDFPKILYCFPDSAGKSFMPSNGTEGMIFTDAFCENCIHEKFMHTQCHGDKQCKIFSNTILEDSVEEWIYSSEGYPICTEWKKWDWSNDEDGFNDPPTPEPDDPSQLLLPFDITDLFGFDDPEILVTKRAIIERELVYG